MSADSIVLVEIVEGDIERINIPFTMVARYHADRAPKIRIKLAERTEAIKHLAKLNDEITKLIEDERIK